ncbi:MAG: hypothetical protein Q8L02_02140 [Candidatus Nitrotoga sp.]|nr:hypothetical protein [Candidatus Nitrotoga sp.]
MFHSLPAHSYPHSQAITHAIGELKNSSSTSEGRTCLPRWYEFEATLTVAIKSYIEATRKVAR